MHCRLALKRKGSTLQVDQPGHSGCGRVGVQRSENEMAGKRSLNSDVSSLRVAHLTDHDYVRILT